MVENSGGGGLNFEMVLVRMEEMILGQRIPRTVSSDAFSGGVMRGVDVEVVEEYAHSSKCAASRDDSLASSPDWTQRWAQR